MSLLVHPSDAIRGSTSTLLAGKRVVLGVSGSISAVRVVELARELLRHGADVVPVMTPSATRILHPNALEFATGHKPILELTGAVEHVDLLGDVLVVAPATGNTVSKMALGIDDTAVTTFATTHLGVRPVLVAPAMHRSMYQNPFLVENLRRLAAAGAVVLDPFFEEREAKLPDPLVIAEHAIRLAGPRTLAGKRVLVVGGASEEPLDAMRLVSNRSTGAMAAALAREAFRHGADVTCWWGRASVDAPAWLTVRRFATVADVLALAPQAKDFDAVLVPAALSDFGPSAAKGKLPSRAGDLDLTLSPLPKAVRALREAFRGALVPFKAEAGLDDAALAERARTSLAENRAAFVVANDVASAGASDARVLLVDAKRADAVEGTKDVVARAILARLAEALA